MQLNYFLVGTMIFLDLSLKIKALFGYASVIPI